MNSNAGADIVAPGWHKNSTYPVNTPDVNNTGALNTTFGYNWADFYDFTK